MKINGYRLIGWAVMGLSLVNRVSQADMTIRTYTGVGSEAIHPFLASASQTIAIVGEPVKQVIVENANRHWQEGVEKQSICALSTKDVAEDFVLVNNQLNLSF